MRKASVVLSALVVFVMVVFSGRPSHAFDLELELLYLEPTNMDTTYATDEHGYPTSVPHEVLEMHTVDHPYAPAYRLTVGHRGWNLSYLSFSDSEKDSVTSTDPANDIHLSTGLPGFAPWACDECTVSADSEIDFSMFSFYKETPLTQGGPFSANYRAGLRYVSIEHDVDTLLDWTDPTSWDYLDAYSLDTSAFGLYAGLNGLWQISNSLDLGFDMGLSLLYGSTDGKYQSIWIDPSTGACPSTGNCFTWDWDKDTIIPMVDLAVRLTYRVMNNLDVFAGYNMLYLANAGNMQEFVDDVNDGRVVDINRSLGFGGPSLGVRYITD